MVVVADSSFLAGRMHRFFFGNHWREAWAKPITVPLIDAANGTEGFRSLRKEAPNLLPPELRVSFAGWIVQDQVSSAHPFASAIVAPLARHLGVSFDSLSVVAIRTGTKSEVALGYRIANNERKEVRTADVLDSIQSSATHRIDDVAYLKARMLDVLVGNANRTPNDWRWSSRADDQLTVWTPTPADFDGAFAQFDGFLPTLADLGIAQIEHTGESFGSIEGLTLNCRPLDRRLLGRLPKRTWDSLATVFQTNLTDASIDSLLACTQRLQLTTDNHRLATILTSRRNQFTQAVAEYYRQMSSSVEIFGTNDDDDVVIKRQGRHVLSVSMKQKEARMPYYERVFSDDYTRDVRLFLLGGDDRAIVEGELNNTFTVIVNGGGGGDTLVDKTASKSIIGSLGVFNKLSAGQTIFDDADPTAVMVVGKNTKLINDAPYRSPEARDWGSEMTLMPWLDVNPDDGLFLGGGPVFTRYAYRTEPSASQISILAGIATTTGRYRFDAAAAFHDWIDGARIRFQFHASQLDLSNYFGLGNETTFDRGLVRSRFYKSDQRQMFVQAALDFSSLASVRLEAAGMLKLVDNNPKPNTLLSTQNPPFAHTTLTYAQIGIHGRLDTRDNEFFPSAGWLIDVEAARAPGIFDNPNSFNRLRGEIRTYLDVAAAGSIVALRGSAEQIWGTHPFFESAFLGGNGSLRGYERQRFAGDAALALNAEVRTLVSQFTFVVPMWCGVSAFAENGRVFVSSESSSRWHAAFGGGIWTSFIRKDYLLAFSVASSEDQVAAYASLGFPF